MRTNRQRQTRSPANKPRTEVSVPWQRERDHLPLALAELLTSSSVSATEDLQQLMLSVSVDNNPESYHANTTNNTNSQLSGSFLDNPESYHVNTTNNTNSQLSGSFLDAQPAQQAQCKVRTEVMEVTRSMLDRSNANFMLWPPCVEVQRCSGCCNTKNLKCVPILTNTRYLQVIKIQYANTRPVYNKAIVSVNDHVDCHCQPAPRSAIRKKFSAPKKEGRNRSGKLRFKDELKSSQGLKLEDLLSQSWLSKEKNPESVKNLGHDAWSLNKTQHGGSTGHYHGFERRYNGSFNSTRRTAPLSIHTNRTETSLQVHNFTKNTSQEKEQPIKDLEFQNSTKIIEKYTNAISPTEMTNQIPFQESDLVQGKGLSKSSESSQEQRNESHSKQETNQNHKQNEQTNQTYGLLPISPKERDQNQSKILTSEEDSEQMRGNETPELAKTLEEAESKEEMRHFTLLKERKALEEEKEELLLLHKLLDEEKHKHSLKAQQHSKTSHTKEQYIYTTTQKTETTSFKPTRVFTPPPRPHQPLRSQKKLKKNRSRLSKAVMRALLM